MHDPRRQAMAAFLDATGWAGVRAAPLAGDASFRRYYRLGRNGSSVVLMDAPPPQEDIGPYVAVAALLRELGLSAPKVLAEDRDEGFLLLEDFGDDTYTRLLAGGADEPALYRLAVDTLIALQRAADAARHPGNTPVRHRAVARRSSAAGRLVQTARQRFARGVPGAVASRSAGCHDIAADSGIARLPRRQSDAAAEPSRGQRLRAPRFPGRGDRSSRAMTWSPCSRTRGATFPPRCGKR